jgi:SnoaL-like domain
MAASDQTELARHALEQVCSGSDPSAAVGVYSPDFHDHVNAGEYHGHDGIRRSLGLYQLVFSDGDLRIRVEDQVSEGERVASLWVAEGHNRAGRSGSGHRDQPHRGRRDRRGLGRLG